jgi:hypothetical protein
VLVGPTGDLVERAERWAFAFREADGAPTAPNLVSATKFQLGAVNEIDSDSVVESGAVLHQVDLGDIGHLAVAHQPAAGDLGAVGMQLLDEADRVIGERRP